MNPSDINENMFLDISSEMKKYFEGEIEVPVNSANLLSFKKKYYVYDYLRFAKLCLYLRLHQKEPDAYAGYSILIFRLTDKEIEDAMSK